MTIGILFIFVAIMVVSLWIASKAAQHQKDFSLKDLLFSGNAPAYAICSNAGSFLSLGIIFCLFAVGMIGYGMATFVATVVGIAGAYGFLHYYRARLRPEHSEPGEDALLVSEGLGRGKNALNFMISGKYVISLACEFAVFRNMLRPFAADFPHFPLVASVVVGFMCAAYVVIGGFRGVVRIDVFQLVIFGIAVVALTPAMFQSRAVLTGVVANRKLWSLPPPIGTITWLTFTFAAFAAFPDVWVRNFGTLRGTEVRKRWFFPVSLMCLVLTVCPIFVVTLYAAGKLMAFDRLYNVPRSINYFTGLYLSSHVGVLQKLLIAAAFLCVFLTTINTWIIGVVQYLHRVPCFKAAKVFLIAPFVAVGLAVIASAEMDAQSIYILGLFVFPFLYTDLFLLFGRVWNGLNRRLGVCGYLVIFAAGVVSTSWMLASHYAQKELFAPNIIVTSFCVMVVLGLGIVTIGSIWEYACRNLK